MTTPTIKIKVFPKSVLKGKLDVRFNQAKGDTGAQGLTGATGATGAPGSGDLLSTNNLSDLANKATALTNLANSAGAEKRWSGDGTFKAPAIFDAKDFAVPTNGTTNASPNMQTAFNAANGAFLYIGDGIYTLSTDITMPSKGVQLLMSPTAHFKGAGKLPRLIGNNSLPIDGAYFAAFPTADDTNLVSVLNAELWAGNTYTGGGGQAVMITTVGPSVASATTYWGMNLNAIVQTGGTGQVVAAEIDVNNYSVTAGLGVGIDLTGEGNSKPWRAIMINRHAATPNWQEGINLANCDLPLHSVVSASGNTIQARFGASFGSASDTQSISFYAAGDTVEFARIAQGLDTTGNKGVLSFRTYNGSSLNQSLYLDQDGNAFISGAVCPKEPTVISAGTYTLTATDSSLEVTANCTLTLPSPVTYSGRVLSVKNAGAVSLTSASTNIQPQAGGASVSTILTATSGKWAELRAHSSGVWIIMKSN